VPCRQIGLETCVWPSGKPQTHRELLQVVGTKRRERSKEGRRLESVRRTSWNRRARRVGSAHCRRFGVAPHHVEHGSLGSGSAITSAQRNSGAPRHPSAQRRDKRTGGKQRIGPPRAHPRGIDHRPAASRPTERGAPGWRAREGSPTASPVGRKTGREIVCGRFLTDVERCIIRAPTSALGRTDRGSYVGPRRGPKRRRRTGPCNRRRRESGGGQIAASGSEEIGEGAARKKGSRLRKGKRAWRRPSISTNRRIPGRAAWRKPRTRRRQGATCSAIPVTTRQRGRNRLDFRSASQFARRVRAIPGGASARRRDRRRANQLIAGQLAARRKPRSLLRSLCTLQVRNRLQNVKLVTRR